MCAIIDTNVVAEAFGNQYGKVHTVERENVDPLAAGLRASQSCVSNDEHVIALAQVSGARLLFSNDVPLHRDFKNRDLVDVPRGKVYSTREDTSFTQRHRRLLNDPALCNM